MKRFGLTITLFLILIGSVAVSADEPAAPAINTIVETTAAADDPASADRLASTQSAQSASRAATYEMSWYTIDGGGTTWSTGGAYTLGNTIGQPDAQMSSGSTGGFSSHDYTIRGGFWGGDRLLSPLAVGLISAETTPPMVRALFLLSLLTLLASLTFGLLLWRQRSAENPLL